MKRHIKFLLVFILTIGVSGSVDAALIGSFTDDRFFGLPEIFESVDLDIKAGEAIGTNAILFDNLIVTSSNVGDEFWATSSTGFSPDTEFDAFVNFLTNGVDDLIMIEYQSPGSGGGGGFGERESVKFGTVPDFQGYSIESFSLKINELEFSSPADDPNSDGKYTRADFNFTFNVYGATPVPEPTTMLLLSTGLLGLMAFGRKKFLKK